MTKDQSTTDKILSYITMNKQASGAELVNHLGNITDRAVRKQLKNLLDKGIIVKIGKPPHVFYTIRKIGSQTETISIDPKIQMIIESRYLYISPTGESVPGWKGFMEWCKKTHQDAEKTAHEYIFTLKKYDKHIKSGFIDGMNKFQDSFDQTFLDQIYYLDFYSIERFGKTKLGQMLLYAKQSQNKQLMGELIEYIKPHIEKLIERKNIEGVLFIPPTVKRENQFMKELENRLDLKISLLKVTKIKTPIIIPQKTLSKLQDRIENAQKTIIVSENRKFKNILIIDDAVGSGATMNQAARQIRERGICAGRIVGLAITGSFKGFDVISEV